MLLGFNHLQEHKFKHNFSDTVNVLCSCTIETENKEHFFLTLLKQLIYSENPYEWTKQHLQYNKLFEFNWLHQSNFLNSVDLIRVVFYWDKNLEKNTNFKIIPATIKFIKTTKRFEEALLEASDSLEIWNNVIGEYW